MKFALIITHADPALDDMLAKYLASVEPAGEGIDYDVIVVRNGKNWVDSVNTGLRKAEGLNPDYYIVSNDDMLNRDPDFFTKHANPEGLTSFNVGSCHITGKLFASGSLWGMHKDIFKQIGYLDEAFAEGINFEDTDYSMRAHQLGIPIIGIPLDVIHYGDMTFSKDPKKWAKIYKNEAVFRAKWRDLVKS